MRLVPILGGALLPLLLACQPAVKPQAAAETTAHGVQSYRLDNGMTLLVKPDHRSPVVVSQVWYNVGSSYEYDGITGVSHALEHMMFKGTDKHPAGEFSEIIAANGGSENAFTSKDYTAYFQRIASDRLEICLQLEADRMRNLRLNPDEFKKEIEVIKEERRMRTEDDPNALTGEQFDAVAYLNSSYGHPIIGWMQDLDAMTLDDLATWYRTWYAPNNATLVVVGNVKGEDVYELAKKYFGSLKPSIISPPKPRTEVAQQGERRITVKAPAQIPMLVMGFKVPVLKTAEEKWEAYALDVLAGVLDGGNSSRLANELMRGSAIAASANAGYDMYARQASMFMLEAAPAENVSITQLEAALMEQIEKLQKQAPSVAELERVKAQVMAANVYEQDSSFYQGMKMGILQTVGLGWQTGEDYLKNIQAVTPDQVQKVAQKYLTRDRLTLAQLDPLPMDANQMRMPAMTGGAQHVR
jgi:zinc protease